MNHFTLAVTSTAQQVPIPVSGHANNPVQYGIQLLAGAAESVYIGGSDVTAATGWLISAGTSFSSSFISRGELPYIVCTTGPVNVTVLYA